MGRTSTWVLATTAALAMATAACGGGGSPAGPSSGPPPGAAGTTITISSSGASPRSLTVPAGTRVRFVNNDSRAHEMTSDPHPEHTDCPAINDVGRLNPGQSRETGNLVVARTCGFHDHDDPSNASWRGTIVIQ